MLTHHVESRDWGGRRSGVCVCVFVGVCVCDRALNSAFSEEALIESCIHIDFERL